jgi:hypothetical protein
MLNTLREGAGEIEKKSCSEKHGLVTLIPVNGKSVLQSFTRKATCLSRMLSNAVQVCRG